MPLPLLGLAAGIGKALVVGTAKAAAVGAKVGAKAAVSSGKFFAKGGASLARGGARVARQGGRQVVKGTKFFKKKVGGAKRKGGEISKKLKENATNLRDSLKKGNKNQDKLRAKGKERKEKKASIEKKRGKEKELESKKSTSGSKKNILSGLAKSPLSIFNKLFGLGGLLLAGILVNSAKGLIDKAKQFVADNKELFDTIGNFLSGIKDAAVGLFDSFTGPYAKENAFDDFAKFSDDGTLQSGKLKDMANIYNGFGDLINKIDKALGGKGTAGNFLKTGTVLAKQGGKTGTKNLTTGKFTPRAFTREEQERFDRMQSGGSAQPAKAGTESTNQPSTGPIDPAHGAGAGSSLSKTKFVAGKGDTNKRIFLHWSAGSHTTPYDAYHSISLGDGSIVRHTPYSQDKGSHTAGANTGSVGLAIAAAAGAQERGKLGQYAPTKAQLDAMIYDAAKLAAEWGWSEGTIDSNVRTHGEWERYATRNGILSGSPQRWDLDRLRDSDPLIDASKVLSGGGNELRQRIKATFRLIKQQANISSSTTPTAANITPTENKTLTASAINQPMDDEGGETIFIQRVNTVQYVPFPQ